MIGGQGEKGFSEIYILFIVLIALAIGLTGGFLSQEQTPSSAAQQGVVGIPVIPSGKDAFLSNGLQLKALDFIPPPLTSTASAGLEGCNYGPNEPDCDPNYPRTCVPWVESKVLTGFLPPGTDNTLKMFYDDEWPMALGEGNISSPPMNGPGHVLNPNTGDQNSIDGYGRPTRPTLFLTDLTISGADSRAGDWEFGGTPLNPTEVFGTWQVLNRGNTPHKAPPYKKNFEDLGPGSSANPVRKSEGYSAEVRWDLTKFNLISGHDYRFELMVHDGDGNGGDSGEKCASFHYP